MPKLTAAERAKRAQSALELRRAGIPVGRIREELGFASVRATENAIAAGMSAAALQEDPNDIRRLELDRLDRLQAGLWGKAVRGDVTAVDRVLRLSELRMRFAGIPGDQRVMTNAFDETVKALSLPTIDAAAVAAGRRVAEQIDAATATGDPLQVTKALYLIPHLMNVLEKLGATPAARDAIGVVARAAPAGPPIEPAMTDLQAFRKARGIS
ncbi:terminase small subunit [Agromyces larvae]|uniref:Terminase small subunit actinomycetes phage-type domain-containing protein n=1 Tax=Agromyces larvae TaxID=2929802 RepID=A0ABY4C2D7_9MICO|nr:hypothetical protein [Agromyces larvae]UOE45484.1 hypothetical protein MTO99_06925 [Agromyces larvae]